MQWGWLGKLSLVLFLLRFYTKKLGRLLSNGEINRLFNCHGVLPSKVVGGLGLMMQLTDSSHLAFFLLGWKTRRLFRVRLSKRNMSAFRLPRYLGFSNGKLFICGYRPLVDLLSRRLDIRHGWSVEIEWPRCPFFQWGSLVIGSAQRIVPGGRRIVVSIEQAHCRKLVLSGGGGQSRFLSFHRNCLVGIKRRRCCWFGVSFERSIACNQ